MCTSTRHSHPLATVTRIATQLKNDPRTIALILIVPAVLVTLLYFVFVDSPVPPQATPLFSTIGPILMAILPMMLMFIVTSVAMLRERTLGTLEHLLTTPISRFNLLGSYAAVFGFLAVLQASILGAIILGPMEVDLAGPWPILIVVALLDGLIGVAFGLLASAFARTEFQAVQFMPLFIAPQLFLCGLFVPKDFMPRALELVANCMPMTWAVDVVRELTTTSDVTGGSILKLAGLAAAVVAALTVASASMPRRTS